MAVRLIHVPYMVGSEYHSASAVPERYRQAGVERLLAGHGVAITETTIERDVPFRDSTQASAVVNHQVAAAVRDAHAAGQLPLVIGSSCEVSLGVLAGFDHTRCGVIWLDAHADFNTPDTTISGFFPGMALALVAGGSYQGLWSRIGESAPVPEENVLLLGVRDLDPAEKERLDRSAIRVIRWQDGQPQGDVMAALDALAARVSEVYLHIDHDVYDLAEAPHSVDFPAPGGLSLAAMETIIRAVADRFRVRAAALTAFNPDRDPDGVALRAGLRVIELICTSAGA